MDKCRQEKPGAEPHEAANSGPKHVSSEERAAGKLDYWIPSSDSAKGKVPPLLQRGKRVSALLSDLRATIKLKVKMSYLYLTIEKTEVTQARGQLQSLYTFHHFLRLPI